MYEKRFNCHTISLFIATYLNVDTKLTVDNYDTGGVKLRVKIMLKKSFTVKICKIKKLLLRLLTSRTYYAIHICVPEQLLYNSALS